MASSSTTFNKAYVVSFCPTCLHTFTVLLQGTYALPQGTSLQGSGLPTIVAFNKNENGSSVYGPTNLAYLGYHNILVQPVPGNVSDLMIDQDLLLVHKMCYVAGQGSR
jgi:hypothetical protein